MPARERHDAIVRVLSLLDLADYADRRIRELSGGMLRRLGIAQAVIHDPQFIILDEPTVGLDPRQRIGIRDNVRRLASDKVVLYSTHLVEDVRALADRVLILRDGQLVFDGTVAEIEASSGAPGSERLERGIGAIMDGAA